MDRLRRHGDEVTCGIAGFQGALLVVGTLRGSLYTFSRLEQPLADADTPPQPPHHTLTYAKAAHARAVRCVALSESSSRIATGSDDASMCVLHVSDLIVDPSASTHHAEGASRHYRIRGHRLPVTQVQWNTSGDLLFSSSYDGVFLVHRVCAASPSAPSAASTAKSKGESSRLPLFDAGAVETVCELRVGFAIATFCMTPDETTAFVAGEGAARVDLLHGLRIDTTCHRKHASDSGIGVAFAAAAHHGRPLAWASSGTIGNVAEKGPVTRLSWYVEGDERDGASAREGSRTTSVDDLWDWDELASATEPRGLGDEELLHVQRAEGVVGSRKPLIRRIRYVDADNAIEVEVSLSPEVGAPAKRWAWTIVGDGTAWTTYQGPFHSCSSSGGHGVVPQVVRAFLDSIPESEVVATHPTKGTVGLAGGAERGAAGFGWSLGHPSWPMPVWTTAVSSNTGRGNRQQPQQAAGCKVVAFAWPPLPTHETDSPAVTAAPRLHSAGSAHERNHVIRRRPRAEQPIASADDGETANVERAAARVAALEGTCSQLGRRLKELLGMDQRE